MEVDGVNPLSQIEFHFSEREERGCVTEPLDGFKSVVKLSTFDGLIPDTKIPIA